MSYLTFPIEAIFVSRMGAIFVFRWRPSLFFNGAHLCFSGGKIGRAKIANIMEINKKTEKRGPKLRHEKTKIGSTEKQRSALSKNRDGPSGKTEMGPLGIQRSALKKNRDRAKLKTKTGSIGKQRSALRNSLSGPLSFNFFRLLDRDRLDLDFFLFLLVSFSSSSGSEITEIESSSSFETESDS